MFLDADRGPNEGQRTNGVAGRMIQCLRREARRNLVVDVRIGLGYTAVALADGGLGVAYTFREDATGGCSVFHGIRPLAPRPASELLPLLESPDLIEAGVGLACANALSNRAHQHNQTDDVLEPLAIGPEDDVGMVGHFAPLVPAIKRQARSLKVFEPVDEPQGMFLPAADAAAVLPQCQVALITATSIINHTIDDLLDAARHCREVVVVGASTPLFWRVFDLAHVTQLSGVVVDDPGGVLQTVSEGCGMREFKPYVRKITLRLDRLL